MDGSLGPLEPFEARISCRSWRGVKSSVDLSGKKGPKEVSPLVAAGKPPRRSPTEVDGRSIKVSADPARGGSSARGRCKESHGQRRPKKRVEQDQKFGLTGELKFDWVN